MLNLILAVLTSALLSVVMRVSEKKVKDTMGMFLVNYIVCGGLSFAFMDRQALSIHTPGISIALLIGAISGILYIVNLFLMQTNIKKNGVVMTALFMKLGVIIPTLMAILIFREAPKLVQIIGFALALGAILLINFDKNQKAPIEAKGLLLIVLFFCGFTDSTANIFDKVGSASVKDWYLLFTFGVAGLCSLIMMIIKKQRIGRYEALYGLLIGVPNYLSARFLLLSLHDLPAVVVYPAYSVGSLVVVSLAGIFLFKEKTSRQKLLAMVIIALALVLLNL